MQDDIREQLIKQFPSDVVNHTMAVRPVRGQLQ